jgi:hypothetical protein
MQRCESGVVLRVDVSALGQQQFRRIGKISCRFEFEFSRIRLGIAASAF